MHFWRTSVLFVGPLIPLFWTSSDICPGFQRQSPHLHTLSPVCNGFLRFTSGATPAYLLMASMAVDAFLSKQETLYLRIPKTQKMKTTGREGERFFAHHTDLQNIQIKINFEFSSCRFGTRISWRRTILSEKRSFLSHRSTLRRNPFTRRGTFSRTRSVSRSNLKEVRVNVKQWIKC